MTDGSVEPSNPVVRVTGGAIRGHRREGVARYTGVPYAAPPTGDRRFRPPAPVVAWEGELAADRYAPPSYQLDRDNREKVSSFVAMYDGGLPGVLPFPPAFSADTMLAGSSEDCLYLDVYVPDVALSHDTPVYVYFHGGANVTNSASGKFEFQSGENLARAEGVIVVQPQYRLGALGWVHMGLVDPSLPEAVNLGLQDQVAALEWVSTNIRVFGGDPSNVTIGGESAGATAVSHLITDPRTRRLARRAILQSLSPFNTWCTQHRSDAEAIASVYQRVLGRMGDADPDQLLALQNCMIRMFEPQAVLAWRPHGAVVDGTMVTAQPVNLLACGDLDDDFEVMIGFAQDEWQFFRGHVREMATADQAAATRLLEKVFGADGATAVMRGYRDLYPERSAAHLLSDALSYVFFKMSSIEIAENLSSRGVRVFVFQFSYEHPGLGGYLRALHTGTLPFVFQNLSDSHRRAWQSLAGADDEELRTIAQDFGRHYGSFIRGGRPGSAWAPYDPDATVLWFGANIESRSNLLTREREIFAQARPFGYQQLESHLLRTVRDRLPTALTRVAGGPAHKVG